MSAGVCPSVCRMPRPNSTTERPMKPKIGRSKVEVTKPINVHTVTAQYLPNR